MSRTSPTRGNGKCISHIYAMLLKVIREAAMAKPIDSRNEIDIYVDKVLKDFGIDGTNFTEREMDIIRNSAHHHLFKTNLFNF